MKSLLLFICMLIIMVAPCYGCGDEWETQYEEMQAQFEASIEAECKYIKCRELDEGKL